MSLSTTTELVQKLVALEVIDARHAEAFEARVQQELLAITGKSPRELGRKFVPELGGVVSTLVPRLWTEEELDEATGFDWAPFWS